MEKEIVRVSGRCKLTHEAKEEYFNQKNKSAFLSDAINYFVHHGKEIQQQLQDISDKLDQFLQGKVVMQEETQEKKISHEDQQKLERIQETLNNFIHFDDEGGVE